MWRSAAIRRRCNTFSNQGAAANLRSASCVASHIGSLRFRFSRNSTGSAQTGTLHIVLDESWTNRNTVAKVLRGTPREFLVLNITWKHIICGRRASATQIVDEFSKANIFEFDSFGIPKLYLKQRPNPYTFRRSRRWFVR